MFRTGFGYDVHKLKSQSESSKGFVVLCGININSPRDVISHSDGDVAFHALSDALIGACGMGDIGLYFPDNKEEFKNMNSSLILQKSHDLVIKSGYELQNIDITITCKTPNFSNHRNEMIQKTCEILNLTRSSFNLKGKSSNGVNDEGNSDAISTYAIVLLKNLSD